MTPPPRANVPTALPMASVAQRLGHGFAGERQRRDEAVLEAEEEHEEAHDADDQRSPATLMMPMPARRVQIPASVLRTLPSRSANAAMLVLAVSSTAPKPIATTPMPLVETPKESLSQLPEITNTEMPGERAGAPTRSRRATPATVMRGPAAEIAQGVRVEVGAAGGVVRDAGDGDARGRRRRRDDQRAVASATNGPRQPNRLMSTATIGAPTSIASAHEISKMPIARARHR